MSGYAYLSQVPDRATQAALKSAFDQIAALQQRILTLEANALTRPAATVAANGINMGGVRLVNVGAPSAETDALNLGHARQLIQAQVEAFGI